MESFIDATQKAHRGEFTDATARELVNRLLVATRNTFSLDQLKSLLNAADDEWRGMILLGASEFSLTRASRFA